MLLRLALPALLLPALLAPAAQAASPPNDGPGGAAEFQPLAASTEGAAPTERQATAELAEATADAGVPRCLGAASFARTAWFRIPAGDRPREVTVEAAGRTVDPVDLALFVQRPGGASTEEPNACAGEGAGGDEATEDRTTAVSLRVPADRVLLVQVGRRGAPGPAEDERITLSLNQTPLSATPRPPGDGAGEAPALGAGEFPLGGATVTEEDPAQPACPTLGSVWQRLEVPAQTTTVLTADGEAVNALTVFRGSRPTGENAVACVERERRGALQLDFPPGEGTVWVRVGTDRPADDARALLRVRSLATGAATGGGPGGGGPGGGPVRTLAAPAPCVPRAQGRTRATRSVVALALAGRRQPVARRNRFRAVPLTVQVARGPVCAARVTLIGPGRRTYASTTVARLSGRRALRLRRVRRLVRGTYRLRVVAATRSGDRARVLTRASLRLR